MVTLLATEQITVAANKRLCRCGCCELVDKYDKKGRERFYKLGHSGKHNNHAKGHNNGHWNGGRFVKHGYVLLYSPNHPFPNSDNRYVYEHRLVVEEYYNCILLPWCDVHHINGIKTDNYIENLQPMMHGTHMRLSNIGRKHKPRSEEFRKRMSEIRIRQEQKDKAHSSLLYLT